MNLIIAKNVAFLGNWVEFFWHKCYACACDGKKPKQTTRFYYYDRYDDSSFSLLYRSCVFTRQKS